MPAASAAAPAAAASASAAADGPAIVMIAKFGKERHELPPLPPSTTILAVKEMLTERTGVLPKRQKLIGPRQRLSGPDHSLNTETA